PGTSVPNPTGPPFTSVSAQGKKRQKKPSTLSACCPYFAWSWVGHSPSTTNFTSIK
ncbi:MAG: hypothetical protein Q9175_003455, partial [Cornicularia normoerica]